MMEASMGRSGHNHHLFNDQAADKIFGRGDVLHALGNRPAIRCGFEDPLRRGKIFGVIEDAFLAGFKELESLVLIGRRKFLGANPGRKKKWSEKSE
jgi:hypothetical protein